MFESFIKLQIAFLLISVLFIIGCSAQQTEEQALANLRQLTSSGKLPPESVVLDIENRFASRKTGALAKLLRAEIRFENKDFAGAASILASDVFKKYTKVADHALWLRGKALNAAGSHSEAMNVLAELIRDHPDSIRLREAKLLWANSAIAAGRAAEVPPMLADLNEKGDGDALLATAKAYEARGLQTESLDYFRQTYFFGAGSGAAKEAEAKFISLGQPLLPKSEIELMAQANQFLKQKNYPGAARVFNQMVQPAVSWMTTDWHLKRLVAFANTGELEKARAALNEIPANNPLREQGYRELVLGLAKSRQWVPLRSTVDAMKAAFPNGKLVAKTMIDAGLAARDGKNRTDESYFFNSAVAAFPNAPEVGIAQFESAWSQHESGNLAVSSQMFIDHLARYADKDNTNRGKAGYWAARDSEKSGKLAEACALYEAVIYRYSANWYGYLANSRMSTLKNTGQCRSTAAPNATIERAVKNLKTINIVPETAGEKELARAAKSDDLSTIGLFEWAMDELNEAKKTAGNSPKINLALARHYRWKVDNTNALIIMMKSYPDYAQMFPEEMDRETWAFFYPHNNWAEIKRWSEVRGLDIYKVAGLIRQESVFTPRAASPAKAYGLMQLIMPTAKATARKYGTAMPSSPEDLYNPALNIELGTAYMKDQLAKYGRIEYMSVAYNAGPGRVPQWRATLPAEMDEFVEAIPFKETKGYVQGIIRNTAQYRRLYDENGNFRPNVGTRPLRSELDSKPRDQFIAENPEAVIDEESN